jgi:hypothetical protein
MKLIHQAADNIVQSRTNPSAGYNSNLGLCGFEKNILFRTSFLERNRLLAGILVLVEIFRRRIVQDPFVVFDILVNRTFVGLVVLKRRKNIPVSQGFDEKIFILHLA